MGEQLVSEFLEEVLDEMSGRSTAKWGIAVLAFVVGVAVAVAIVRRRSRGAASVDAGEADDAAALGA